ncbi:hypothetical protein [Vreelandella sp. TE19]
MANMKRVSFTLPPEVVQHLNFISHRLGVSKSSVVGDMLGKGLSPLVELLRAMPDQNTAPSDDVIRRVRGASSEQIRDQLNHLREVFDSLDDPSDFELSPCADRPAGCNCDYSTGERLAPSRGCIVHGREDD